MTSPSSHLRPRALMLTVDYAPQTGGQPLLVSSIVESTSDMVDWRVITAAEGPESENVVRVRSYSAIARAAWQNRAWLEVANDRLVVSAHAYLGPIAHLVGAFARSPVSSLCYGRELVPASLVQRIALTSMRFDHRVVTISSHSRGLLQDLGVADRHSCWVPCELKPRFGRPDPPTPRAGSGVRLISVTRLAEGYKNIEVILRAFAVLAADGTAEHYTIVGDGPRRDAIAARVEQLGLADRVTLTGRLSDSELREALAHADIGIFSSRDSISEGGFEGFGIAIQELASAGLPVVAGHAAGAVDATRSDWALMVDPDNTVEWVEAIASLADDEERRFAMAEAAHEFGSSLDTTVTARSYLDALRGVPAPTPMARRNLLVGR